MASITYDGRSFMLDGRRVWLVSGSIHYARIPRAHWRDRVHAAKLAGLNTIELPIVWSHHEARAGSFDFKGERDVRHLIELIQEAGLRCILRVGPFIGGGYDFGGLPPWLTGPTPPKVVDMAYRTHNAPFLEATSRYITALAKEVKDLQVTAAGEGGPIILAQSETGWTCGDDELAQKYLGELGRFLREAGLTVPVVNANNLWTEVEGELDGWSGREHMLAMLRQLGAVRPNQPRIVIDFPTAEPETWGQAEPRTPSPASLQRHLVEILAAGGQFNLAPFASGANHGDAGGRLPEPGAEFVTQAGVAGAPLQEHGGPGASFHAVRRVSTFASNFGRVLAALDPEFRPITLDPQPAAEAPKAARQHSLSIVHATGSQGSVVFLIGPDPDDSPAPKPQAATLLMPDGASLDINTHAQPAAWCLFDVNLTARAKLDYCTFCALAQVGDVFVCFGAAGVEGSISINGSPISVAPSKTKDPVIIEHEGLTLVVLSEQQSESAWITEHGVCFNARGARADGKPLSATTSKKVPRVAPDGSVEQVEAEPMVRAPAKPALEEWRCSPATDYSSGQSPRYAAIAGPEDLTELGAPYGYGWYRIRLKAAATKKVKLIAPDAGDRLQFIMDGEPLTLVGLGPGADDPMALTLPLKKGEHEVVILAENMGRFSGGVRLGEKKGLFGQLWETQPFKAGKGKVEQGDPIDPLDFIKPLWEHRVGDKTHPDRLTWHFTHRRKAPLIITIDALPGRALVILNEEPIAFVERGATERLTLDQDTLNRGANTFQLALLPETFDHDAEAETFVKEGAARIEILEATNGFTEKAEWAFAKWEAPAPTFYDTISKTAMAQQKGPTWWKTTFESAPNDRPLSLDLSGLTKGRISLNGNDLGRYFVATQDGKTVPPQDSIHLPLDWLETDGVNELVVFDEHGGNPSKCKLAVGAPDGLLA